MNKDPSTSFFKKCYLALGILSAAGLIGYSLAYIIKMPQISPGGFVPSSMANTERTASQFGNTLAVFILLYAFPFLPVSVMFTIKKFDQNPYALVLGCCLTVISIMIEIINNLPLVARLFYPGKLGIIPDDTLLYLKQEEILQYLSFDVAGFSLLYMAFFIVALVFIKSQRWLAYTIFASIALFIANVPCLWFAPNLAIILMACSIFAIAPVPIYLARMAIE
jgi:hypothetical protein